MSFITPTGVAIQAVEEILAELAAEQQSEIDPLVGTDATNVLGQLNGIYASHEREDQEAIQELATALNPDNADGAILDGICAITGTFRNAATATHFSGTKRLLVSLEPGAIVTADVTKFSVTADPTIVFTASETVENIAAVVGNYNVKATCDTLGPIPVVAGTVTTILTPTTGVNSVNNPTDAVTGRAQETDAELRLRRDREIRQAGSSSAAAIASDLLALENDASENPILSVVVLENTSDTTDANFLPPHSFEAVIWDGPGLDADDDDVAEVIHDNRSAGVASYGTITSGVALDGSSEAFSRATQVAVEIPDLKLKYLPGYVGDVAVKAALKAAGDAYQRPTSVYDPAGNNGDGVVPFSYYIGVVMRLAGVSRVIDLEWHLVGEPLSVNEDLYPAVRQIAVFDTSLITVNSTPEAT